MTKIIEVTDDHGFTYEVEDETGRIVSVETLTGKVSLGTKVISNGAPGLVRPGEEGVVTALTYAYKPGRSSDIFQITFEGFEPLLANLKLHEFRVKASHKAQSA